MGTEKMKRKTKTRLDRDEIRLDREFERMEVKPRIYHFVENVYPYRAITVAMDSRTLLWEQVLTKVVSALGTVALCMCKYNRTTELIKHLKTDNIYGVAVCDIRDQFSRKRGRVIAKGRLLKYLKKRR